MRAAFRLVRHADVGNRVDRADLVLVARVDVDEVAGDGRWRIGTLALHFSASVVHFAAAARIASRARLAAVLGVEDAAIVHAGSLLVETELRAGTTARAARRASETVSSAEAVGALETHVAQRIRRTRATLLARSASERRLVGAHLDATHVVDAAQIVAALASDRHARLILARTARTALDAAVASRLAEVARLVARVAEYAGVARLVELARATAAAQRTRTNHFARLSRRHNTLVVNAIVTKKIGFIIIIIIILKK